MFSLFMANSNEIDMETLNEVLLKWTTATWSNEKGKRKNGCRTTHGHITEQLKYKKGKF